MGLDYALVHLKYTIPPAIALTLLHRPFATRLDFYKIGWLILFAVSATLPWDSYLIRRRIWTYPPDSVIGPVIFSIPIEEFFFFIVQTYTTSLLYLLITKPVLHAAYLGTTQPEVAPEAGPRRTRWLVRPRVWAAGQLLTGLLSLSGMVMVYQGGRPTYLGLILAWAGPFMLLLWNLAYPFIVRLSLVHTLGCIAVPTLYLWVVDTLALKRGTWAIQSGTKLGLHLWPGLEIEEATFFLVTNTVIVLGMIAFANAVAILHAFPRAFPVVQSIPSPVLLLQALFLDPFQYDERRAAGIVQAVDRLKNKSRSFHLASATFEGRLRIDLVLLYSFCRIADDLVDDAPSRKEAESNVAKLRAFLDAAYATGDEGARTKHLEELVASGFSRKVQDGLLSLPVNYLSAAPLYYLLEGFETDLQFSSDKKGAASQSWPIVSEADLEIYGLQVAGTVAELCLDLVFHHARERYSPSQRSELIEAGRKMGVALQITNISRDIAVDARLGRVYIPQTWLKEMNLTPEDVLKQPNDPRIDLLRDRLLDKAEGFYGAARPAIEQLPANGRSGMRVAVESYMEIGRVLREKKYQVKAGRATVPKLRRLRVLWRALTQ